MQALKDFILYLKRVLNDFRSRNKTPRNLLPVTHIFAQNDTGSIGHVSEDGQHSLPWQCPDDMRHFAAYTRKKVCICGSVTYKSFPKPLKDRTVIVVSSRAAMLDTTHDHDNYPNYHFVTSVSEALTLAKRIAGDEEIVVIGGREIYRQTIDNVNLVQLSIIQNSSAGNIKRDWVYPPTVTISTHIFTAKDS